MYAAGSQNLELSEIHGRKCTWAMGYISKRFNLCLRCLGERHKGKSCQEIRPCGQNGCQKLHHVLLHRNDCRHVEEKPNRCLSNRSVVTKTFHNTPEARYIPTNNNSTDRGTFGTDGNHVSQASPMQLVCLSRKQEG